MSSLRCAAAGLLFAAANLVACSAPSGAPRPAGARPPAGPPQAPPAASSAAPSGAVPAQAPPAVAPLPERIAVPRDQAVFVAHAPPGERRAIVYLHGRCGDVHAFRTWARAAGAYGTIIALVGDEKCKGGWRSTWSHDVAGLDRRIRGALAAVGAARGVALDDEVVTVVGYSLGATRAEALAKRFPGRYTRLILIGAPTTPEVASFPGAGAVVLMAGALDRRRHLEEATASLAAAGIPAVFLVLPGAKHGEYGPEAERVLGEALRWAFEKVPASPAR